MERPKVSRTVQQATCQLSWAERPWKVRTAPGLRAQQLAIRSLAAQNLMPMTAAAQGRAKSRLAGKRHRQGQPSHLTCLFALCSVSGSSIRINPDPDCNSSSSDNCVYPMTFLTERDLCLSSPSLWGKLYSPPTP